MKNTIQNEVRVVEHTEGYKNIGCRVELFEIKGDNHKFKMVLTLLSGHNIKVLKESFYTDMSYEYKNFEIRTAIKNMKELIDCGAF